MEYLALTMAKPKSAPSASAANAILKRNLGKWRPRFLLCYMAPPSNGNTAWLSGTISQPRKIHAFPSISGPALFAATKLSLEECYMSATGPAEVHGTIETPMHWHNQHEQSLGSPKRKG